LVAAFAASVMTIERWLAEHPTDKNLACAAKNGMV
jgi:hypothetical protein